MKTERTQLRKKLDAFEDVYEYFQKLSKIDMVAVRGEYGSSVEDAFKAVQENLEIGMLYQCDNIASAGEKAVTLECGVSYTGEMPMRILKDSKQVISFVISLCGYTEMVEKAEDIMEQYFLDVWGSAYVEAAQGWLGRYLLEELRREGMSGTHLWSPGQHGFELSNQRTLFRLLEPEEIGCSLTESFMIVPVKSVSGIMGIVSPDAEGMPRPCDFCSDRALCPIIKSLERNENTLQSEQVLIK